MNLSAPFIRRPVATALLTLAVALAGAVAYSFLPVSPLPQIDFPTVQVSASLPGAAPETMASAVATPLERQFGRIAGLTEMTSTSYLGSTTIVLQFDLSRNIDAATRDVQAAINAAAGQLPTNLPNRPTYRKVNPADAPILILGLTSQTYDRGRMYDVASSILQQRLSQVRGVGQVIVGGGALPAVRVDVNPTILNGVGLSLEDVRAALGSANANRPKGALADGMRTYALATSDQLLKAKEYQPLIVAYSNGSPVRLSDVATVSDSVEDIRTGAVLNGQPAVALVIFRQPGANIIATVDRVRALMPQLQAEIPAGIRLSAIIDRSTTIRESVREVEKTLVIAIALVILVVLLFLRDWRTTLIPAVAVPVSLIGTFGVMYLAGYSVDNLSLMALTIAASFVVDDAIVVIENVTRHLEQGRSATDAALQGAREIGFTVLSMSISLVAVFIPILLMGGLVGRLFREFAVVLSVAILVSLVVSLTTTPMMCAKLPRGRDAGEKKRGAFFEIGERAFRRVLEWYESGLSWALRHSFIMLLLTLATVGLTVYLYVVIPKGFFPQQDTGRLVGQLRADQDTSFQTMSRLLAQFTKIVNGDPAVDQVIAIAGGASNSTNTATAFVSLKPLARRGGVSADEVVARLRRDTAHVPGATLYLQAVQDLRVGGRPTAAQYQFTLGADRLEDLNDWAPKVMAAMRKLPSLREVNSDQQNGGLEASLTIDRATAQRMGISAQAIDDTLYDAFGQRQVSTMFTPLNQYHVVLEAQEQFWQNPDGLKYIRVRGTNGALVPLGAFSRYQPSNTPLAVNHSGQFPSVTISFNLKPGASLSQAVAEIENAGRDIRLPASIHGTFSGTAQAFQASLSNEPLLIAAALAAVYVVLGILYESYIHPITILSTLPSAGVGALLALLLCRTELNVIGLIGIVLLIGIVKKNAIMMVDFALESERRENQSPRDAIFQACLLRFRPIMMTTMAALLGALPLALGTSSGSELRRPLGIAIVGGLLFSQVLTLYTTPVIYLYLDRLRLWWAGLRLPALRTAARPAMVLLAGAFLCFTSTSCSVGPNYRRPGQELPLAYKSTTRPTTQPSTRPTTKPSSLSADWWRLFGEEQLTRMEDEALAANSDLKAAMARVAEARAAARITRSEFFPTVTLDPSLTRSRSALAPSQPGAGTGGGRSRTVTDVQIPFDLTYEIDVWGRVRRAYQASVAQARASANDYHVVLLTLTADVAQDYFTLRSLDAQDQILLRTVESFRRQVALTQTQYKAGIAAESDVLQAQTQLESTVTQEIEVRRQRADLEHALAILLGRPPANLTVAAEPLSLPPPTIPVGMPADLLRQRADVAEAEQNLIAASAQVGVATAQFYPTFTLTGAAGFESLDVQHALDWESRIWSIGPSVSFPIFEGGKLRANLAQARARYDELAATYRSTVLGAVRDVEDALTDLHHQFDEAQAQQRAVASAREFLRLSQLQYERGLISYLQVIDAERTLLSSELSAAQLLNQRLTNTVLLIKAIGGGWDGKTIGP